jgi:cyclopropane fatty-acyl-phospholipid synthase-like methyltransferase
LPSESSLPYRDFLYPLNVLTHVILREEGAVPYLHYGLFDDAHPTLLEAQERSTAVLFDHLPAPPARLLDVGIGLGTTLDRLRRHGYAITGITPDALQIAFARARFGNDLPVLAVRFEDLDPAVIGPLDVIFFQESSQYIPHQALFSRAGALLPLGGLLLITDEFATRPLHEAAALHQLASLLATARDHGFELTGEQDYSADAAPTIDYFLERLPRYRHSIVAELHLTDRHVDELIASGRGYRALYDDGTYVYRLLQFRRVVRES